MSGTKFIVAAGALAALTSAWNFYRSWDAVIVPADEMRRLYEAHRLSAETQRQMLETIDERDGVIRRLRNALGCTLPPKAGAAMEPRSWGNCT